MEKMLEQLKNQGFSREQINEIELGQKAGLDTSVYARVEFLAIQMHQIRLGMLKGLAVEKYASIDYDWFQMEEIRKGLLGGIDVDIYAFPDISYDKMRQIRLGLCDGIDISLFKKLDAGVLKELRQALRNRVALVPYITAGYDAEQLEMIRMALEKGLDIDPYLKKELRGVCIREICEGLEHGVDVSVYAGIEYSWQQMREIRLGLECLIDVDKYKNPYYSWQQMREIRLGLEEGLDVSYYTSFQYTAAEMQKRRIALEDNPAIALVKEEIFRTETDALNHYLIILSPDEMEAYVEVQGNVSELSRADLLKALRNMGIVYGIQYDVIEKIVTGNSFRKSVLIARGKPAEEGKDGWYEFFFRTQVARTPKELEGGYVDYRNVEWFEMVDKGQKLAYYHSAQPGVNGVSVTGKNIPAKRGRELSILTGKGFKRLPDGKTYLSELKGIVTLQDLQLEVSSLLVMEEVNLATGDVNFQGNVCVTGNVSSGTKIHATGDVFVKGFVEASEIICGGSAVLQKGMNGSGTGLIKAGKDVVGCFFEAVELEIGGNIQGDYFLNCKIHAEGFVYVTGRKGMLAGGIVFAEKGLKAKNLGNQAGIKTYVKLGISERIARREKELDEAIRGVSQELHALENAHQELQKKYPPEIRNTMELYLKIESAVYTKEKQMEGILSEKRSLKELKKKAEIVSATIENQLYEGVSFEIDGLRWPAKKVQGVTIKKRLDKIAVYSN